MPAALRPCFQTSMCACLGRRIAMQCTQTAPPRPPKKTRENKYVTKGDNKRQRTLPCMLLDVTGRPKLFGGGPSALPWQKEGGSGLRFFWGGGRKPNLIVWMLYVCVLKRSVRGGRTMRVEKAAHGQSTRSAAIFFVYVKSNNLHTQTPRACVYVRARPRCAVAAQALRHFSAAVVKGGRVCGKKAGLWGGA
jgi:hypothetical protein